MFGASLWPLQELKLFFTLTLLFFTLKGLSIIPTSFVHRFHFGHRGLQTPQTSRFVPKMRVRRPLALQVRILPVSLQEGCASAAGAAPSCPQVR